MMKELIKELKPDKSFFKKAEDFKETIKILGADVIIGGSVAMDTNIKGKHDVDIFIIFEEEKDISKKVQQYLDKNKIKYEIVHGSRDYFQVMKDNIVFELIPVAKVKDVNNVKNIIDMSPMHVHYFNKKATNAQKDEVRLAKAFCDAINIYGAESYINGFSGYTLNLLILKYKTFENLLKNASKWQEKVIIDLENHLKDPLMELDKSKIQSPIILVDPVQPLRNAAAALNKNSFEKFKNTAKLYLKKPSREFFEKKPFKPKGLTLKIKPLKGKKDIVATKILKIKEFLEYELVTLGFELRSAWHFNEKESYICFDAKDLPEEKIHQGPPLEFFKDVEVFKKKYPDYYIEQDKIKAKIKNKHKTLISALKELIKKSNVKQKCAEISVNIIND